jgi:hypothetical protein
MPRTLASAPERAGARIGEQCAGDVECATEQVRRATGAEPRLEQPPA